MDPGDEADRIMDAVKKAGIEKVPAIFLTHGHGDHISALDEVKAATGAKVYMSREDAPMLRVWNSSLSYSTNRDKKFDPPDAFFTDGEKLTAAGLDFTIAATPGHTRGGGVHHRRRSGVLRGHGVPGKHRPDGPARGIL